MFGRLQSTVDHNVIEEETVVPNSYEASLTDDDIESCDQVTRNIYFTQLWKLHTTLSITSASNTSQQT